ncbi:MAG: sulfurtransferase TusA family protein [Pirellulaceae bacterium]|nr:sulfurtransferase TusA family protein [Pirellulaceae bacterium]
MPPSDSKTVAPHAVLDGGDLDCGSGLLLLIRKQIDPLNPGQILEIRSTEQSVEEDLPAWCRMTGNDLLSASKDGRQLRFLVSKGPTIVIVDSVGTPASTSNSAVRSVLPPASNAVGSKMAASHLPEPALVPSIQPLSVMGIGSWPRPRWMLQAMHDHLEGRLAEREFQQTADDAVRLSVQAQLQAGVDVVTDGEQRRDSYASFVGGILDNCQLIPLTDLMPYVDDPRKFEEELRALDVPAGKIRHPAVFGPLARSRPLAVHELRFVQTLTDKPVKVALPGPYLLTRTMWLECISDRAYETRERLADDIVRILREELFDLLAAGAALVQFDEPVLSEVAFGKAAGNRSFMCGALSERRPMAEELAFAGELINRVTEGVDATRTALHICRGNWTRDESVALHGGYEPLIPLLQTVNVGTFFLELCTPRAGEIAILARLPDSVRIGVGVVNQKLDAVETVDQVIRHAEAAIHVLGSRRVLLNPDCGFATFADNPIASAEVAAAKLANIAQAAAILRRRFSASM